ncbi:Glycosyl transferases group 1 [Kandleria vitulina]|uniref:Glycosyl transferases group 1 n=1 Tax=Kandleria vitulina TaxID=1630 RepID=A0A1H2VPP6_9FIRM|nr:glycosyltransferase [Kandleria vitulina]SDW69964.1 Glycosyl transferases group 1 [Kandleria vitulina]
MVKCNKWKTGCDKCPQLDTYPKSFFVDNSKQNYLKKNEAYQGIKNLTIITPSEWLAGLVKQSVLSEFPVEVVNNKINLEVFKPIPSDVRNKYAIKTKYMVLGVAVSWDQAKGLQDIFDLRKILPMEYSIVLVGGGSDQKLLDGIIGIPRTKDQLELAKLYTAADVFINPTHQDNYPTVNLEARACGTPVVTYDVGGSPESAGGKYIVEENDIRGMKELICKICQEKHEPLET